MARRQGVQVSNTNDGRSGQRPLLCDLPAGTSPCGQSPFDALNRLPSSLVRACPSCEPRLECAIQRRQPQGTKVHIQALQVRALC